MSNATQSEGRANPADRSTTGAILRLAEKHLGEGAMVSSATLCHADAVSLLAKKETLYAERRALESIAYSVGVFHADYARAAELHGCWR